MPGILEFITNVRETSFILDALRRERGRTRRIPVNIKAASVRENPSTLTSHCFIFFAKKSYALQSSID